MVTDNNLFSGFHIKTPLMHLHVRYAWLGASFFFMPQKCWCPVTLTSRQKLASAFQKHIFLLNEIEHFVARSHEKSVRIDPSNMKFLLRLPKTSVKTYSKENVVLIIRWALYGTVYTLRWFSCLDKTGWVQIWKVLIKWVLAHKQKAYKDPQETGIALKCKHKTRRGHQNPTHWSKALPW